MITVVRVFLTCYENELFIMIYQGTDAVPDICHAVEGVENVTAPNCVFALRFDTLSNWNDDDREAMGDAKHVLFAAPLTDTSEYI
ncbi:hypothetical protein ACE6H2_028514 [Prunus campanulata]